MKIYCGGNIKNTRYTDINIKNHEELLQKVYWKID